MEQMKVPPIKGFSDEYLQDAWLKSRDNKDAVLASESCGCFYCRRTFKPSEIVEWEKSPYDHKEVGLCPYCYVDSLLGSSQYNLTPEFLDAMSIRHHFLRKDPAYRDFLKTLPGTFPESRWQFTVRQWKRRLRYAKWWVLNGCRGPLKTYRISSVRIIPKGEREHYKNGVEKTPFDKRDWGFYARKRTAMKAVRENWTNLHENYYRYCCIEQISEGIYGDVERVWWHEWDKTTESWQPLTSPPPIIKGWHTRSHVLMSLADLD